MCIRDRAKPTTDERAQVRHHLIDIADPDETVGLAQFLRLARAAILDSVVRHKIPFLVGGTGQYVRALLQGWQVPEIPPDPALRADLERQAAETPDVLWERLLRLDPDVADFIDPRNIRRIIRALEVTLKSNRPFSEQRRHIPVPYRILQIGLTLERDALYARADARVDAMMAMGLLDEVRHLVDMGYGWDLPAMSGLGYIQFQPYLEGQVTLEAAVERIKLDTHDFIRRQYAWFRPKSPDIQWLGSEDEAVEPAMHLLDRFLKR